MADKWVYCFDQIDEVEALSADWEAVRSLLGGKGANLGDMTRLGVPVPPGFTITTAACNEYLARGSELPPGLWDQVLTALADIEEKSGKRFGDTENPLLLSCRSGSKFSMPGMMDTVLDLGLNPAVVEGMIKLTNDPHFVYDSYRRLIQMFGSVVLGVRDEPFEEVLSHRREERGVDNDTGLTVEDLMATVADFEDIVRRFARVEFPHDPQEQLRMAVEAVFKSWNGKRARDYRTASKIPHDLGTGVNVQMMVYGNMGDDSATGVAMSRSSTTGERSLEGDFLKNAQGEDVVAGIRPTLPIESLHEEMPEMYRELDAIAQRLEEHYRDMQDMEFTVESGRLWLLQTRSAKRTAQAAVRIAVDMANEGLISREEAVGRVTPGQVDFFLHPQFSPASKESAQLLTTGLNVSPGAAVGVLAFTADLAERWAKTDGRKVIMVRPETKPDDVHGMLAAEGILTSAGGRTSHAALVARQFGKPAVVGASALQVDVTRRTMSIDGIEVSEGDVVSIDGTTGEVFLGELETIVPDVADQYLAELLGWADGFRRIGVWANADYPEDARKARNYGAEGIGLCRTEHMFFEPDRLPIVQQMITAKTKGEQRDAVDALLPIQRSDFVGIFQAMAGLPVIIRLLDPPLHEFLPSFEELSLDLADQKIRLAHASDLEAVDEIVERINQSTSLLERVDDLREANPMLGTRGVRLGIQLPALVRMQVRAILEAACQVTKEGVEVKPEIMIPLTSHAHELAQEREVVEDEAATVMEEQGMDIAYKVGTMIEVPRAALTAGDIAEHADFFSFGTNDLTQMTFGISRDDAESGFLIAYLSEGILPENPFATIDQDGVGRLMEMAIASGRAQNPDLEIGICGEHGGDPASIAFCDALGLDYVSCSPYRVPVARLAAAQAALEL